MRLQWLVLLVLVLMVSTTATKQLIVRGWDPINIYEPYMIDLCNFAVTEYDKQTGSKLKFEKIIKAESMVVEWINYRLILSANDGSHSKTYKAVVWETTDRDATNLTSFAPVVNY